MRMLTALMLFVLATPTMAFTGNDYLENMAKPITTYAHPLTEGYLYGVLNQFAAFGAGFFCLDEPEGVTNPQKIKIVEKYLADNPEKTHMSLEVLAVIALIDSFGKVPMEDSGVCP